MKKKLKRENTDIEMLEMADILLKNKQKENKKTMWLGKKLNPNKLAFTCISYNLI